MFVFIFCHSEDLKEIGQLGDVGVDVKIILKWNVRGYELDQDNVQWQAFVIAVMNLIHLIYNENVCKILKAVGWMLNVMQYSFVCIRMQEWPVAQKYVLFCSEMCLNLVAKSKELSPWEANNRSASQEIALRLWNPKVHYRLPVHTLQPYFPSIHSNIIFPSMPRSSEWSLPFSFSDKNLLFTSYL
jgi:hypothetical protein